LSPDELDLLAWLERAGVLEAGSGAKLERAGDGNLNLVRRVRPARGPAFVVKRAPPHVEGHPQYALPAERIAFEARYARVVAELAPECAGLVPRVLHFDPQAAVLVMEDLGEAAALDARLRSANAPRAALERLGSALAAIHARSSQRIAELAPQFANDAMRRLNGVQMFEAPYAAEVPGLGAALEAARRELIADEPLRRRVASLAGRYASSREALVHGDAKAPNVLLQGDSPRLIDAEFAHVGDPGFDLGVALGHLFLHTSAPAARAALDPAWEALMRGYRGAKSDASTAERAARYAGAVAIAHVIGPSRVGFASDEDALHVLASARPLLLA